jgi:hypothetical protein
MNMNKIGFAAGLVLLCSAAAYATPSTQIWIPSTDIQPYKKLHFGFDQYLKARGNSPYSASTGGLEPNVINNGLTIGVLPTEKVQMEVGIDQRAYGIEPYDSAPIYWNAKLGTPEGSLFDGSPAIAVGGFDFGTKKYTTTAGWGTDYNIVYGLIAKTLGKAGRISVGYYSGNDKLLLDKNGKADEADVLASWDRTISELSDKLWIAVDYMGGKNSYGALSYGVAWKFAPNVGVIFGMDDWNNSNYKPTYTIQVDIDL